MHFREETILSHQTEVYCEQKGKTLMNTEIALQKLQYETEYLIKTEAKIKREYASIESVISQLKRMETPGLKELVYQLRSQQESLDREKSKVTRLRMTLEQIIRLYSKCEDKILNEEFVYNKQKVQFRRMDVSHVSELLKQNQIFFQ